MADVIDFEPEVAAPPANTSVAPKIDFEPEVAASPANADAAPRIDFEPDEPRTRSPLSYRVTDNANPGGAPPGVYGSARDVLQEPTLMQRFRNHPLVTKFLGEPLPEVREMQRDMGGGQTTPMDLVNTGFKFAAIPPQAAEPMRKGNEWLSKKFLPDEIGGIEEGAVDAGLNFPIAAAPVAFGEKLGTTLLGVFSGDYVLSLPDQKAAFDQAMQSGNKREAYKIATSAILNAAILGVGGAHEATRIRSTEPPARLQDSFYRPVEGEQAPKPSGDVAPNQTINLEQPKIDFVPESGTSPTPPQATDVQPPKSGLNTPPENKTSPPQKPVATVGDVIGQKLDEIKTLLAQHKATPETPADKPATITEKFTDELRANAAALPPETAQPAEATPSAAPAPSPNARRREKREIGGDYTLLDAVRENGGLGGPDLSTAMKRMAAGETPRKIAGEYGADYDALDGILEELRSAAERGRHRKEFKDLAKAYRAAGFGGEHTRIDETLDGIQTGHRQGLGFAGGVPDSASELVERAWDAAHPANQNKFPTDPEGKAKLFWDTSMDPASKAGLKKINADQLKVGDTFRLRGKGLSHEEFEVRHIDPDTGTVSVKDGPTFGWQELPEGTDIFVKEHVPGNGTLPKPARMSVKPGGDLFSSPESVADQKARLAGEKEAADQKAAREQMLARQAKPLTGQDVDTTKEMFGGEVREDKAGQRSLFSVKRSADVAEPGDPSLWNIPDNELEGRLAGATPGTPEHHNLELEAKARGMIDKTTAEEETEQRNETRQHREAQDKEISRRQQDNESARRRAGDRREPVSPGTESKPEGEGALRRPASSSNRPELTRPSYTGLPEKLRAFEANLPKWQLAIDNARTAAERAVRRPDGSIDFRKTPTRLLDLMFAGGDASYDRHVALREIQNASHVSYRDSVPHPTESAAGRSQRMANEARRSAEISAVQRQAHPHFEKYFKPEPWQQPGRLKVSDKAAAHGSDRTAVEQAVQPISKRLAGARVNIVQSESELPEHLLKQIRSQGAEGRTEGVFDPETGKVHLIADNIDSPQRAREVFLHETVGHLGVRKVMGAHFDGFMDGVFSGHWDSPTMRSVVEDYGFNLKNLEDRRAAAEEVVARLAENPGTDPTLWQRVVAQFKQWARQLGMKLDVSESDIRSALRSAERSLETSSPETSEGTARFSFRELEKEGEADRPKWLSKDDGNEVWKLARDLVNAGDTPDHAIRVALSHLQSMGNKDFNFDEARRFAASMKPTLEGIKSGAAEPVDNTNATEALPVSSSSTSEEAGKMDKPKWQTLKDDLDKRHEELIQAIRDYGTAKAGKLEPTEGVDYPLGQKRIVDERSKKERYQAKMLAGVRYREAQRKLRSNPDYIADIILSHQRIGEKISAAGKGDAARELISAAEEIQNELSKCPQNIVAGVYEKMQQDGRLPKDTSGDLPQASRSLSSLVDWLRGQDIDSPKKTLADRFNLVRIAKERAQSFGDAVSKKWIGAQSAWKAFVESYKSPPADTDFRRTIKDWSLAEETVGHETRQWEDEINQKVSDPVRRKGISHYLFAKGDQALLDHWATSVPERFKAEFEAARSLTDSEKAVAQKIKQEFDQKLLDATLAGMVDKGRENYGVPMLWDKPPKDIPSGDSVDEPGKQSAGNWRAKLDPRDPFFALQRSHDSYFDGIMAGGVPLTTDVGKLVAVYNRAFSKNLSSRAVIWALKDAKAADGLPVVKVSGSAKIVPQGTGRAYLVDSKSRSASDATVDGRPYMSVDHWALRNWKFVANTIEGAIDPETGKPFPPGKVLVQGDMLVHPDHYGFLKNELQQPWRDPKTNELTGLGKVVAPLLKTKMFLTSSKFALGTFHMFTLGEHVIFHGVNPFMNGFRIDLREPEQASAVRNGLLLGFDREQTQFQEGLGTHGGLWSKVPGLGDAMAKMTDFVFKTYLPTMKMKLWQTVNERNLKRYGPDSRAENKLTTDQVAELSAQQVNAALGGQNWRLMGRDRHLVDLNRLLFSAPDFLISRAKVVGQAMKPYGREQQRFLVTQAAMLYIGARVFNKLLDDDPHWGWDHAFSVIYKNREYSVRTIVSDMHHMMTDGQSFLAGRLGPWVRAGHDVATGRDMRTGAKIRTFTDAPGLRRAELAIRSLAEWLSPIGSEGLLPGKAKREQTALSTLGQATVGLGSQKFTAQTQMYELADKFNRKQPDARAQNYATERESRVGTESVYRALNDYLEAGKLDEASKEYQSLVKDGHKPETIEGHYSSLENRPFTGDAAREEKFKRLMTPEQKQVYNRAKAERAQLKAGFDKIKQSSK